MGETILRRIRAVADKKVSWFHTPALATHHGERSKLALARSIAVETVLGLGVVLAAGVLGSLEPGMHLV